MEQPSMPLTLPDCTLTLSNDLVRWSAWYAGCLLHAAVGALLATPTRRWAALAWSTSGLVLAWFAPAEPTVLKATLCMLVAWAGWVRVVELASQRRPLSPGARVWQVVAIFDTRALRHGPPRFEGARLASALLASFAASACAAVALGQELDGSVASALVRYTAGAAFVYLGVQAFMSVLPAAYHAAGLFPPELHRHPILARTLAEFWAVRWNRIVGSWLKTFVFLPFARRRGVALATALAFLASAVLHAYFVAAALGLGLGLMMGSYFLIQGVGVLVERAVKAATWRASLTRVWATAWVLLPSPLFVEPFLRLF